MTAASCSQWIACSPMRNGSGGRPLNSVVRRHLGMSSLLQPKAVLTRLHEFCAESTSLDDEPDNVEAVHITHRTRGLKRLPKLQHLRFLFASEIRESEFSEICKATQVTHLSANVSEVQSLRPVHRLTNLVALALHQNTKVTALTGLEGLAKLQVLELANFAVAVSLEPLSNCKDLRYLWLSGTTWTPMRINSLQALTPLAHLGWLMLPGVRVKDRSLKALHNLNSLAEVRLPNSFSDKEVTELAKVLPN